MRNLPCLNNPGVRAATPEQCLHGARPPSGDNNPGELGPTPAAAASPHPAAAHTTTPAPAAPAAAHYLPGTPLYLTPDGTAYRHIEIGPNSPPAHQDPAWTQLLTAPIP